MEASKRRETYWRRLVAGYGEWLSSLNYEAGSVVQGPRQAGEFCRWLEVERGGYRPRASSAEVSGFLEHLSARGNRRTGGALSASYLRSYRR